MRGDTAARDACMGATVGLVGRGACFLLQGSRVRAPTRLGFIAWANDSSEEGHAGERMAFCWRAIIPIVTSGCSTNVAGVHRSSLGGAMNLKTVAEGLSAKEID